MIITISRSTLVAAALVASFMWPVGRTTAALLTLGGSLTNAGTPYSSGDLDATYTGSGSIDSGQYTGVPLWTLLGGNATGTAIDAAGNVSHIIVTPNKLGSNNQPILRNYVLASGIDGNLSLLSVGEIDPFFGGVGNTPFVAYKQGGSLLTTPMLIVPNDPTGTRNITSLTGLVVGGVPGPAGGGSPFSLSGVDHPRTYSRDELVNSLPAVSETASFLAGSNPNPQNHPFTGVSLWDLLKSGGIGGHDPLTSYLLAKGSDGFEVLFSLAELDSLLGAPSAPPLERLLAYDDNGTNVFARTVIPGDVHGGRYVSGVVLLQVADVPEPATLALLVLGWIAMGTVRRRPELRLTGGAS